MKIVIILILLAIFIAGAVYVNKRGNVGTYKNGNGDRVINSVPRL